MRPEIVEQLAEQDSIAEGLRQVEHLRRVPGHTVVGGQHLAVDEPLRALLPRLHARRLRDTARPGQAARMRPPPRFLHAPPTPAVAGPCPAGVRGSGRRGRLVRRSARGSGPVPARLLLRPAAAAASPSRSRCAPAGSAAAAAHRLPTREPGARRLSMPSAPAGLAAVCESPEARWESAAAPAWGPCPGRGSLTPPPTAPAGLRSVHPYPHPAASGDFPSCRLPGSGKVGLNTVIHRGSYWDTPPRWRLQFFKGSEGSERLIGARGVPREKRKGPRAS